MKLPQPWDTPQEALKRQDNAQRIDGYADCMEQSHYPGTRYV